MQKILVIPDTQVKPGIDLSYLTRIGRYIIEKQPDVIVHMGDHWDMPSLSSYDVGKKTFEGRRYKADINAGNDGMSALLSPMKEFNDKAIKNHRPRYNPRKVFLLGNHCHRIERAINDDAKLDGTIGYQDLDLSEWEVQPFLQVVSIAGIAFSHYFVSGVMGRPVTTASALLSKKHQSCFAGHQQGKQIAYGARADGTSITAIISGSAYEHDEEYMGVQGNKHWRGIWMLHEPKDGAFDEMPISLDYLKRKYG